MNWKYAAGAGALVVLALIVWWYMRSTANAESGAAPQMTAGGAPSGMAVRQRAQALAGAIAAPTDVKGEPNRP